MNALPWVILFLPLAAAAVIFLVTRRSNTLSAGLSIGAVTLSFLLSVIYVIGNGWSPDQPELLLNWLQVGGFQVDFGIRLDPLSLMMLLVVTGVGACIHWYSFGYMQGDKSFPRYFGSLSLFMFSMLGIVLANNFVQMFIFWELVGLSSYLLIGFWFEKPSAADAAKKAFITNRIGDFGFLLGIIIVWTSFGTVAFSVLESQAADGLGALGGLATAAGLLIFCGAVGKSAQFPLHVWLPDAMEGPTPVSALIHAATMVAAGVYMLCRVFFLLNPEALEVIAWIGGVTALLAALMAIQQDDIKRILAYSTLSQLGYMVMTVGVGGPSSAMFHLTTHAFFKALLFLGAGAVIHALHHEQNIWKMGGLKEKMPITFWTFLIATLAICGVPPLSGFYSKEAMLAQAYENYPVLFALGGAVAALTTFYMFRLLFVVFYGTAKGPAVNKAHEVPRIMSAPLVVLAVLTVFGGFMGIKGVYGQGLGVEAGEAHDFAGFFIGPIEHAPLVALFSLLALGFGFSAAFALYKGAAKDPLPASLGVFSGVMRNRFYFDEIYSLLIQATHEALAKTAAAVDRWIIAGALVRGAHGATDLTGRALRLLQTGNLQTYAFLLAAGVAILLYFALRG